MNNYEAVFIFPSENDAFTRGREYVKGMFQQNQATVVNEKDMGERDLAYPVKKQNRGHYYLFETEMEPTLVAELDKSFKIRSDVLKYLFVRKE